MESENEERKWEELGFDCLLNILERLDNESLLLNIPYVCKWWYKVSLSPSCWRHIDLSNLPSTTTTTALPSQTSKLFRFVVARGNSAITSVVLPRCCNEQDLQLLAHWCPHLTKLSLKLYSYREDSILPKLIKQWKELEELRLTNKYGQGSVFRQVVGELGRHCRNFKSLVIEGGIFLSSDALAIGTNLPQIRKLTVLHAFVSCSFEIIANTCHQLEFICIMNCCDNLEEDYREKRIREIFSHIKTLILG